MKLHRIPRLGCPIDAWGDLPEAVRETVAGVVEHADGQSTSARGIKNLDTADSLPDTRLTAVVSLTPESEEQADKLPEAIVTRLMRLVERLENWPDVSGAKPLRGALKGRWRMRTGDYRLQFRVEGETVVVEKIGHRDRFYED